MVILCAATGLPLWEALSYKQRTPSSLPRNNFKRTSYKDVFLWEGGVSKSVHQSTFNSIYKYTSSLCNVKFKITRFN